MLYFLFRIIRFTILGTGCVLLTCIAIVVVVVVRPGHVQQGKITAQGKLLLHGQLYCTTELSKLPSKEFKELQVFLFEQAIIFSEIVGKRTQFIQPVFIYKAHIQVLFRNDITRVPFPFVNNRQLF